MGVVVNFVDFTPPARFDGNPWTQAELNEAATSGGTYAAIETVELDPVDSDPGHPLTRSFTTDDGTATARWYHLVWIDGLANRSSPTVNFQNTETVTAYATAAELAGLLNVKVEGREGALARVLNAAAFEINEEIGIPGPINPAPDIVVEVNLERAVEHWHQQQAPFGIMGLGGVEGGGTHTATDSWKRHAEKLSFLKQRWGIA